MLWRVIKVVVLVLVVSLTLSLAWLRWEAGRPRDAWFVERQGTVAGAEVAEDATMGAQLAQSVRLRSTSGLEVSFRVIRPLADPDPLPVFVVLGGHRTGSDAVELFGEVGSRAVVGIDYPYDGPDRVKGIGPVLRTIPPARQAFLDTVPAVSLVLDWLSEQPWADGDRTIMIGASLGAPFAAAAARRDDRIAGLVLVHAAADNRRWLEVQLARRMASGLVTYPLSHVLHWLAYGPVFDTGEHVAHLSPRPLLVINARDDERTPADEGQRLYDAAGEPKKLRFSNGRHVQPGRSEIIGELLAIAEEETPFLVDGM